MGLTLNGVKIVAVILDDPLTANRVVATGASDDKTVVASLEFVVHECHIIRASLEAQVEVLRKEDARKARIPGMTHHGKGERRRNRWSRWHG